MDTTLYNDSRPEDGMDEQERERAEQERYDLETLARFRELASRLHLTNQIDREAWELCSVAAIEAGFRFQFPSNLPSKCAWTLVAKSEQRGR